MGEMQRSMISATVFRLAVLTTIGGLILAAGCATVPKESVQLSYTVGQDLEALHGSYKLLINRYFDSLRWQVNKAIDEVFIPAFINDYVKTGGLIEHAQNQRADLVEAWARLAVEKIDQERQSRLAPLNEAERDLMQTVDEAFDRAVRANATVTAHLNSITEVQEVHEEILEALNLGNLRREITDALVQVSDTAGDITKSINEAAVILRGNNPPQ
jgi:hypothetical protein